MLGHTGLTEGLLPINLSAIMRLNTEEWPESVDHYILMVFFVTALQIHLCHFVIFQLYFFASIKLETNLNRFIIEFEEKLAHHI